MNFLKILETIAGIPVVLATKYTGLAYIEGSQEERLFDSNIDNNDIDNAQIFENNKESSFCDKDLNEKIIKLFVGNHPLLPMKTIKKIARCNLMNQYYKSNDFYNVKVINEIILNECCHIVAEFKDYLIQGDFTEFLQQYYKKREIYTKKVNKI